MSEDFEINKEQYYNETIDEYGVINPDSCFQYQECNLENMKALLVELFGQDIINDSNLQNLCSDDVNKLDVIKSGISQRFGACITIEDIVKSNNIVDFTNFVINVINSPRFPVSEKEVRRNQLADIVNKNSINPFWGELISASKKLSQSKTEIEKIKVPINLIGHNYQSDFINKILDFIDRKVTREELKNVVVQIDKNTKDSVTMLSDAIENTNMWIDAICKMLIWIIQIENDIYGLTEEASVETLRLSKLLSQEGVNIEGLTEVAAMEQSKRQRMHQKIKEFKADIEGKIEFLNNVHQVLLSKFEEHKTEIKSNILSLEQKIQQQINEKEQKLNNDIQKLNNDCDSSINKLTDDNNQTRQTIKDLEQGINTKLQNLKDENNELYKISNNDISSLSQKIQQLESDTRNTIQKKITRYKLVSYISIVISVAAVLFAIIK